jgi:hypothetical protein
MKETSKEPKEREGFYMSSSSEDVSPCAPYSSYSLLIVLTLLYTGMNQGFIQVGLL